MLKHHPDILQAIALQYRLVLIDEIQDLSPTQLKIAIQLSQTVEQSILVGDDAQSIYHFRGAKTTNFDTVENALEDCKQFSLKQTHRCTQPVSQLASLVRSNITGVEAIKMQSKKKGSKPILARFKHCNTQYNYVVKEVIKLHEQGINYSDIAIISRFHESLADIQRKLDDKQIPFNTFFTESDQEFDVVNLTNVVIALLKLISQGYNKEHIEFIFHFLAIETTPEALAYIEFELQCNNLDARKNADKKLESFGNVIHKGIQANSLEVATKFIIEFIVKQYEKKGKYYIKSHLTRANRLSRNFVDTEKLIGAIQNFEFDTKESVSLLTAHSAKGLEYKVVFVIDADDTKFPFIPVLKKFNLKKYRPRSYGDSNEEQKLFYVAITRSSNLLYITSLSNDKFKPTRFLPKNGSSKSLIERLKIRYK